MTPPCSRADISTADLPRSAVSAHNRQPRVRRVKESAFWRTAMRGKIISVAIALLALGVGGARFDAQAEPLKIRGAWVAPLANLASVWLQKKDLAVHFGQSYIFEPVRYAGTPPMITAIANNELEIGNLAFSTLPIAIENAGLDDIRVISDDF